MKEIATKTTTTYILDKYRLHALKKYGQNFLIDVNVINKIISCASLTQDSCVIEVGPGIGALTQILSRHAGMVRSYEIDQRFKPVYQEFLNQENIEILFEDFLKIDLLKEVSSLKSKYNKVCLVANLPYYITSDIIEHVVLSNCGIDSMVIMVQKEVALKLTSNYTNPLTLMIEDIGKIEYMFTVSKNIFMPMPHVDSAIIKITINNNVDKKLYEVLKSSFKQRRKTIANNLKEIFKDKTQTVLQECNIDGSKRAEQLNLEEFKSITKYL